MKTHRDNHGFTLIEMSIVLIIIGLIVGGILVGQELISAAGVRATIAQIEKYNTAANTFRSKYGYLPGDLIDPDATNFGFTARGTTRGTGDGNGVLEGQFYSVNICGLYEPAGETLVFWQDLSTAKLIDGGFHSASETTIIPSGLATGSQMDLYIPQAKLGGGNYIYVFSGVLSQATTGNSCYAGVNSGVNYFGLSAKTSISFEGDPSNPGLTVKQAYAIDSKMDDGLPQRGNVIASYIAVGGAVIFTWATPGSTVQMTAPYTTATPGSATTCFDNGGVAGPQQYSMAQNGGAGVNCGLSFRFQ